MWPMWGARATDRTRVKRRRPRPQGAGPVDGVERWAVQACEAVDKAIGLMPELAPADLKC